LVQRYPPDPLAHRRRAGFEAGSARLTEIVTAEHLEAAAQDATHQALLDAVGWRSGVALRLRERGRVLGSLLLGLRREGRRYTAADLPALEALADRAALAIDNARLYSEAQAAVGLRDQFLAVAAHELRTPLTSLLAAVQLAQRRLALVGLGERDARAMTMVSTQASRLNRMIGTLLDVSRIQTGQLILETAPLDLSALVARLATELEPTLGDHPLQLDLPAEPVWIEGDALRLEQVVANLVSNAAKYSPAGALVTVRVEADPAQICLHVSDQGIGIPPSALPHLFTRFYRAPNVDSNTSGMGIGLYVVKEIVTLHGGTVSATADPDQGSTFTVCLPVRPTP
jgi:signal transduction histidine kinase